MLLARIFDKSAWHNNLAGVRALCRVQGGFSWKGTAPRFEFSGMNKHTCSLNRSCDCCDSTVYRMTREDYTSCTSARRGAVLT